MGSLMNIYIQNHNKKVCIREQYLLDPHTEKSKNMDWENYKK